MAETLPKHRKPDDENRGLPLTLPFSKYEGLGNDFIVLDARRNVRVRALSDADFRALCDRHRGIGADGILILSEAEPGSAVGLTIINADGSRPEMCGNGVRCVGRALIDDGTLRDGEALIVATAAGPRRVVVRGDSIEVDMGAARLDGVSPDGEILDRPFVTVAGTFLGTAISMGNPHLVLAAPAERALAMTVGPLLEHHPSFPKRVNVGFASPSADGIALYVWERGAGLTEACGTGACAAAVAFVVRGLLPVEKPIAVDLPGGRLEIVVPAAYREGAAILMRGPARRTFVGSVDLSSDSVTSL